MFLNIYKLCLCAVAAAIVIYKYVLHPYSIPVAAEETTNPFIIILGVSEYDNIIKIICILHSYATAAGDAQTAHAQTQSFGHDARSRHVVGTPRARNSSRCVRSFSVIAFV